jgi:hypothetical protein
VEVSEKSRLEKLLGMLGSSFDGERANAARMIQAMAEKAGLTIAELIYGASGRKKKQPWSGEKSSAPPPRQNPILKALHDISGDIEDLDFVLTEWECQFASDVAKRYAYDYELSEKQIVVAEKIIRKVESARAAR